MRRGAGEEEATSTGSPGSIEYVGTLDTTIPGSRNAFTPLMLWYAFHTVGEEGIRGERRGSVSRRPTTRSPGSPRSAARPGGIRIR